MALYDNRLYIYVLLPLATLIFLVVFLPLGLLFGLINLYMIYKHREPQRLALEAKQKAEKERKVAEAMARTK
ncbi:MAG: hypothetical protein ABSC64_02140 [Candidatus Korobacteraceae bacterium]